MKMCDEKTQQTPETQWVNDTSIMECFHKCPVHVMGWLTHAAVTEVLLRLNSLYFTAEVNTGTDISTQLKQIYET